MVGGRVSLRWFGLPRASKLHQALPCSRQREVAYTGPRNRLAVPGRRPKPNNAELDPGPLSSQCLGRLSRP